MNQFVPSGTCKILLLVPFHKIVTGGQAAERTGIDRLQRGSRERP